MAVTWKKICFTDETTLDTDADISGKSWVVDEDDMISDLNTKVPTQQSVKAHVAAVGGVSFALTATLGTL